MRNKHRIVNKGWKWLSIPIVAVLIVVMFITMLPSRVSISSDEGFISLQTHIALAAQTGGTFGNGEPVPQQIEPTFSRGGPPIVSIAYNFNAITDVEDVLIIINDYGLPTVKIPKGQMKNLPGEKSYADIELRVNEYVQKNCYEIWVLLSSFPADDPVRNGILLDNERIVKLSGKDYLVISLAYFAVHIYSLEPLRFTTRINGLDAGLVTGVWW